MRDSDWSRQFLLRSDWLGLIVASITTYGIFTNSPTLFYFPLLTFLVKLFKIAMKHIYNNLC